MISTTKTKWVQYTCENRHVWNVDFDNESPYRTQVECNWPRIDRTDDYAKERGILVAGTFHVLCPTCGYVGAQIRGRGIRGSQGGGECGIDCEKATGPVCKCQCGGMNHGIVG